MVRPYLSIFTWSDQRRFGLALRGHDHGLPAFGELWVTEYELVRADRDQQVRDRRLSNAVAVERDLGPRPRVDAHRHFRWIDANRDGLARGDFDPPRVLIPEAAVQDRDFVAAAAA